MTSWQVIEGDCREAMAAMEEASVDAVVTDPPYGLEFMGREWDRFAGRAVGATERADHLNRSDSHGPWGRRDRPINPNDYGRRNEKCLKCRRWRISSNRCTCPEPKWEYRTRDEAPPAMLAFQEWSRGWALEAKRVLKPGGHLLAFGGTRTYHRLTCAIEDAGFEIRDCLVWLYGGGFPKSLNLDRLRGETFCGCDSESATEHDVRAVRRDDVSEAVRTAAGQGSLLLAGVPEPGAPGDGSVPGEGATDGAQPRVEGRSDVPPPEGQLHGERPLREGADVGVVDGPEGRLRDGAPACDGGDGRPRAQSNGSGASPRPRPAEQRAEQPRAMADERLAQDGRGWPRCDGCGLPIVPRGLGTALKPAHEPIVVARKSLSGTVAETVLRHGTGALNVDGCRVGYVDDADRREDTRGVHVGGAYRHPAGGAFAKQENAVAPAHPSGRWPANVALDDEAAAMLDEQAPAAGGGFAGPGSNGIGTGEVYGQTRDTAGFTGGFNDRGGASRFFYVAKAAREERGPDNTHPTVKPIALMRWLVRLVTPPDGIVLDPFAGSGTTGIAALREGFSFVGIEREADYCELARERIRDDAPLLNTPSEIAA